MGKIGADIQKLRDIISYLDPLISNLQSKIQVFNNLKKNKRGQSASLCGMYKDKITVLRDGIILFKNDVVSLKNELENSENVNLSRAYNATQNVNANSSEVKPLNIALNGFKRILTNIQNKRQAQFCGMVSSRSRRIPNVLNSLDTLVSSFQDQYSSMLIDYKKISAKYQRVRSKLLTNRANRLEKEIEQRQRILAQQEQNARANAEARRKLQANALNLEKRKAELQSIQQERQMDANVKIARAKAWQSYGEAARTAVQKAGNVGTALIKGAANSVTTAIKGAAYVTPSIAQAIAINRQAQAQLQLQNKSAQMQMINRGANILQQGLAIYGAKQGAAVGSVLGGPGLGTAAGAAVGGALGYGGGAVARQALPAPNRKGKERVNMATKPMLLPWRMNEPGPSTGPPMENALFNPSTGPPMENAMFYHSAGLSMLSPAQENNIANMVANVIAEIIASDHKTHHRTFNRRLTRRYQNKIRSDLAEIKNKTRHGSNNAKLYTKVINKLKTKVYNKLESPKPAPGTVNNFIRNLQTVMNNRARRR